MGTQPDLRTPGPPHPLVQRLQEIQGRFEDQFSERHLHCVWYDPRYRPLNLHAVTGERIQVLQAGEWNLEAGPDFLNATLEIDGRRVQGDVEIHIRAADWRAHGHQADPRYGNVRLHVCFYPGTLPEDELPPGCLQLALQPQLGVQRPFHFEAIDCRAYPWEVSGDAHPLAKPLGQLDEEQRIALLEQAGAERLRRKTQRMYEHISAAGPGQGLYRTLLRSLGYKQNGAVMEWLAERLPLEELRSQCGKDAKAAYALLLGVAGLLPAEESDASRDLWARWWKRADRFHNRLLPSDVWQLDGMRPANHPARRLWAAAHWFTQPEAIEATVLQIKECWHERAMELLDCPENPCEPHPFPGSQLGPQRKACILVNALLPYCLCLGSIESTDELLSNLPREANNQRIRRMATLLWGPDHHPRIYRSTICKQGLLQFYEDYVA